MKISANEIRVGNVLEYKGRLYYVAKTMHTQPGKGGAYVQVEMKDVITDTKQNIRFRSSETVDKARLEQKEYQFLYLEEDKASSSVIVHLMDTNSYEQIEVSGELFGEAVSLLKESMMISIESYEEKPLSAKLPENVEVEVIECEPVVKGQTAASSFKPSLVEGNLRVMVPPFISQGDKIIIKSENLEYFKKVLK